ncbi:hypothetical protein GGS23DRAFT_572468, partial [Durotheca rogersii]|uniref:uncharacterized protein n=1 Tax=Durotheca rogersii TaxID=419775 RepID=UPI00221EDB11
MPLCRAIGSFSSLSLGYLMTSPPTIHTTWWCLSALFRPTANRLQLDRGCPERVRAEPLCLIAREFTLLDTESARYQRDKYM